MSRLEDIRARLAAATPGPWGWRKYGLYRIADDRRTDCVINDAIVDDWDRLMPTQEDRGDEADADLIAHAPQDIADLLAFVDDIRGVFAPSRGTRPRRTAEDVVIDVGDALARLDGDVVA